MTDKDKEYFKMLKERDTAKPMKKYKYRSLIDKEWKHYDLCPTCGDVTSDYNIFCPHCGQRIDHQNYEL